MALDVHPDVSQAMVGVFLTRLRIFHSEVWGRAQVVRRFRLAGATDVPWGILDGLMV